MKIGATLQGIRSTPGGIVSNPLDLRDEVSEIIEAPTRERAALHANRARIPWFRR